VRKAQAAWAGRWNLTWRILAVNVFGIILMILSVLYLDVFRDRLVRERERHTRIEAAMAAAAVAALPPQEAEKWLAGAGKLTSTRYRLYAADGSKLADNWRISGPTYQLRDPAKEHWKKDVARALDRGFNSLTGEPTVPDYVEPKRDTAVAWPELSLAKQNGKPVSAVRSAPDFTPLISGAAVLPDGRSLLATENDRLITKTVRRQRAYVALVLVVVATFSILLSLFLARTIVRPLRRIALAAHRVRLGRAREVRVPRLPSRRDEIGLLARSVADMSQSLRHRIDNIEAFAADVTHELKNPLASLRSALDGIDSVKDRKLRQRLMEVAREDVVRLDRLISDISEAARTDAELARARFEPVDLGPLIEQLVGSWESRRERGDARIAFARPRKESAVVLGDPGRLARAIENVLDNAVSFSPPDGLVEIAASRVGNRVRIRIDDEGPGVPAEARESIFNRFHSIRPEKEQFGRHSGLGLAIAKAIVEGHNGEITVLDRDDAPSGARFIISLPATEQA
jgi:two-component system sensor histidine kinase ChvG